MESQGNSTQTGTYISSVVSLRYGTAASVMTDATVLVNTFTTLFYVVRPVGEEKGGGKRSLWEDLRRRSGHYEYLKSASISIRWKVLKSQVSLFNLLAARSPA